MSNITLAERKLWVGASEVADLFGVGFSSRWIRWLEKAGRIEPEDLSANENIKRGQHFEPAIAAWAADKWGMKIRKVRRYIPHPYIKGFGASLDYEMRDGVTMPVEIKSSWNRDGWDLEGDTILDAPLKYLLQVQAQMACTGAHLAWLVAEIQGKLYRMQIERHPETITRIEAEVAAFWLSVEEGREPKPDFSTDGGQIAALMQISSGKVTDLTQNNHLPELCADYLHMAAQKKEAEGRMEASLAEIRTIVGDAGKAICNGFTISNTMVKETPVSYVRKGYCLTRITEKKEN
jgi:putative phage-type endonuclease